MQNEEPAATTQPQGHHASEERSRDFFERLMQDKEPAHRDTPRVETRVPKAPQLQSPDFNDLRRQSHAMSEQRAVLASSLVEAGRYVHLARAVLLASLVGVAVLAVATGFLLVAAITTDAGWQEMAISGAVCFLSVTALFFLLFRPGGMHRLALTQLAQLETAQAYLDQTFEVWDKFFQSRIDSGEAISTDEVSLAISSLTESCGRIFKDADAQAKDGK